MQDLGKPHSAYRERSIPNLMIGTFPFMFIPGFFVPLAMVLARACRANYCAILSGEYLQPAPLISKPDYMRPGVLREFIPLVYSHVRFKDDIDRAGRGAYTPGARDYAERFRAFLLERLAKDETAAMTSTLQDLAIDPRISDLRDWILNLLDERLEREADLSQWTSDDLRSFAQNT